MVGYEGLIPFSWRRVQKDSFQNSYRRVDARGYFTRKRSARKPKTQRLGSVGKRSWNIRLPKMRVHIVSPFTLLARLRDAYVRFMMNLAGRGSLGGLNCGPMSGPMSAILQPPPGRKKHKSVLTETELRYLDHLRKDRDFMLAIIKSNELAIER